MTLFIACLLIYNFGMEWWWYGIAGAIWVSRLLIIRRIADESWGHLFGEFDKVRDAGRDARTYRPSPSE